MMIPTETWRPEKKNKRVQAIFKKLDEKCQQLLTYSIFNKLPMTEIAQIMDFSDDRVARVSNHRCKQKLAKLLQHSSIS